MQAVYIEAHGGPEVLTLGERPEPEIESGPGEGQSAGNSPEPSRLIHEGPATGGWRAVFRRP